MPAGGALGPVATPTVPRSLTGTRRDVLEALAERAEGSSSAGGGAGVDDLARALGVHPNSVRGALASLADDGLVDVVTEAPAGRGRPAHRYAASVAARSMLAVVRAGSEGGGDYRMLAEAFASHLSRRRGAAAQAREVGALWGSRLVEGSARGRRARSATAVRTRVLGLLADLGFGPAEAGDGESVLLRTCPILASASANPEVICSVHLGLVEGAREALGAESVEVAGDVTLEPFALPGACRLRLPV